MAYGNPLASLAASFSQVIGPAAINLVQQRHSEELSREALRAKTLEMLGKSVDMSDPGSLSAYLNMLNEFTASMGKGKKGEKQQQGILSQFGQLAKSGIQTTVPPTGPKGVQGQAPPEWHPPMTEQPDERTRARRVEPHTETRPFLLTPEREGELEASRQRPLLELQSRLAIKKVEAQEVAREKGRDADVARKLQEYGGKAIINAGKLRRERIDQYLGQQGLTWETATPEQRDAASQTASVDIINEREQKLQRDVEKARLYAADVVSKMEDRVRRGNQADRRLDDMDQQIAINRGKLDVERGNQKIRIGELEYRQYRDKAAGYKKQMDETARLIQMKQYELGNSMVKDPEAIQAEIKRLTGLWDNYYEQYKKVLAPLGINPDAASGGEPSTPTAPAKPSLTKKGNDPLGIR